jgi:hypothetical protein
VPARLAPLVLLAACSAATTTPDPDPPALVQRYAVTKSILSHNCATPPTLRNHEITVDRRTAGQVKIDDGNGTWTGTIDANGAFTTDPRVGTLADGATLRVTLSGTIEPTRFNGRLDGVRTVIGACTYAIAWVGEPT